MPIKKGELGKLVCEEIGEIHHRNVTQFTRFDEDLGADGPTRRTYYAPIQDRLIDEYECRMVAMTPEKFQDKALKRVGDLIGKIWADLQAHPKPLHLSLFNDLTVRGEADGGGDAMDYVRGYRDGVVDLANRILARGADLEPPVAWEDDSGEEAPAEMGEGASADPDTGLA